jgi:hypothetical protein
MNRFGDRISKPFCQRNFAVLELSPRKISDAQAIQKITFRARAKVVITPILNTT